MGSQVPGSLHVANDVIVDIITNATQECYGVVGMVERETGDGAVKLLSTSRLNRGVAITDTDNGIHVDLYVVIEYGTNIQTVSQNLIDQVNFALKENVHVPIAGVEVHVQDVRVRR